MQTNMLTKIFGVQVRISDSALTAAAILSDRYITDR